jgi:non-homologous end joining protein Ku
MRAAIGHDLFHIQLMFICKIETDVWRFAVRKLIAFDDDTFDKLKQLARDRMATFQELADEAFADLLKKHGIPIDLKDALRKSVRLSAEPNKSSSMKRSRSAKP